MNVETALDIQHVTKRYAAKTAVDDATFAMPTGGIFGLLGPNGAGKTSLIRMMTRITLPDAGNIRFFGQDLQTDHQRQIGYMPEERGLYRKMKVGEQLVYLLQLKDMTGKQARALSEDWLRRLDIFDWRNRKVEELSKGMQQKIQFIATVAHKPRLLILDEPFSGLDPINAQLIEDILHELCAQGTAILLSTHRMEQVEQLCQSIALINNAKVVLADQVDVIRARYNENRYVARFGGELPQGLDWGPNVVVETQAAGQLTVRLQNQQDVRQLIDQLNRHVWLEHFELQLPTIRDIFIRLVKPTQTNGMPLATGTSNTNVLV